MAGDIQFKRSKDRLRKRLVKYTRKAFLMLPRMDRPRILDVGCGSGVPTMELARLSGGEITGLDIDQELLDELGRKIKAAGMGNVNILKVSILDMDFPDESFDIVWSEGSIFVVGFEKGLREWRRFLKPDGFLVVHDAAGDVPEKVEQISHCGYDLLGYFVLSSDTWWEEYFAPLEKLASGARQKYPDDSRTLELVRQAQREIDMFRQHPERNSSVCFVMKKRRS